jgi:hypothetical protein
MGAVALATGLGLASTDAVAEIIRAKRYIVSATTAYRPCTAPDTTTDGTGTSACAAPLPADAVCRLGTKGRGKVVLRGVTDNIKMLARMDSIDPACNGETLQVRMSFRVTSNDCAGQTCTLVDFVDQVMGSCEVSAGICRLETTLNGAVPNLIVPTNETHVEVLGCDFKRITGPSLPTRTFTCGLMIP